MMRRKITEFLPSRGHTGDCLFLRGIPKSWIKLLSHIFYMIDLSGHCFSATLDLMLTLDLTFLSPDISRTCFEISSSAPQLKCTHNTHNIRWSELKQAKLFSLSSHLLAVFVAFMWNKERVNRAKAQSYTAAEH